jgi:hypothetical protein
MMGQRPKYYAEKPVLRLVGLTLTIKMTTSITERLQDTIYPWFDEHCTHGEFQSRTAGVDGQVPKVGETALKSYEYQHQ